MFWLFSLWLKSPLSLQSTMASMIVEPPDSPRELPDENDFEVENMDLQIHRLHLKNMPEADAESWVAGYKMLEVHNVYTFVILLQH